MLVFDFVIKLSPITPKSPLSPFKKDKSKNIETLDQPKEVLNKQPPNETKIEKSTKDVSKKDIK